MNTTTAEFIGLARVVTATLERMWDAWFRQACDAAGIAQPHLTQPRIASMRDEAHARALAAHLGGDAAITVRVIPVTGSAWIVCVDPAEATVVHVPVRCEDVTAALSAATH